MSRNLITLVTAMPRCDGLPTGPCPKKVNNRTVKSSICDLFLCPSCEATRFPPRPQAASSVEKRTINGDNKHAVADTAKVPAATVTVATVTNLPVAAATNHMNSSDDEHGHQSCYNCQEDITGNDLHIICSICCNEYHQRCSGLSEDVFGILLNIVDQSGWVCRKCRLDFNGLKANLAKVNEELADMRTSVAWLFEELKSLKDVSTSKPVTEAVKAVDTDITTRSTAVMMDKSEVQLEVCRTIHDATKRKCNVVVTGLPEIATSSPTDDCDTFTKFCEEHLCVKPALSHRGCRRLGKRTDQRHRRLLVHLTSENSVTSLLAASRALRRNETTKDVYINPDLSKIESKLAFEQRERRRAAKQQSSLNPDCVEFHPGEGVGTDTPIYNSHFPILSADSPPAGYSVSASVPVPDPFL